MLVDININMFIYMYKHILVYTYMYIFTGHLITKRLMIPCAHAPAFAAYPVGNYSDIYRMQLRRTLVTVIYNHTYTDTDKRIHGHVVK